MKTSLNGARATNQKKVSPIMELWRRYKREEITVKELIRLVAYWQIKNCLKEYRWRPYPTRPEELKKLKEGNAWRSYRSNRDKFPRIKEIEDRYIRQYINIRDQNAGNLYYLGKMKEIVRADGKGEALKKVQELIIEHEEGK